MAKRIQNNGRGRLLALMAAAAVWTQQISEGGEIHVVTDRLLPSNAVNLVTRSAPRPITVRELGLEVLQAGPLPPRADEIRIFSDISATNSAPLARIWRNSREGGRWWYAFGGKGNAENHVIQTGQAVFVFTRASTNVLFWRNPFADEEAGRE